MKRALILLVAAFGLAVAAAPALAGHGHGGGNGKGKGKNPVTKSLKGAGTGTTTVSGIAPVYSSSSAGTLKATHLGKTAYTVDATQDWTGASWPGNPCASVAGTFTYTAANGDAVSGDLSGTTCELVPYDDSTYESTLTATITGGTGNFANATGSFDISGVSTATDTPGVFGDAFTLSGTITY